MNDSRSEAANVHPPLPPALRRTLVEALAAAVIDELRREGILPAIEEEEREREDLPIDVR